METLGDAAEGEGGISGTCMLLREAADVLHCGDMLFSLTAYIDRWERMTVRPDGERQAPRLLLGGMP
jgi:hypothetical protein